MYRTGNLLGPQFAGEAIGVVEAGYKLGPGQVDGQVGRYALLMLACYAGGSVMSFLVKDSFSCSLSLTGGAYHLY